MTRFDCLRCEENVHINDSIQIKIEKECVALCFDCINKELAIVDKEIRKIRKKKYGKVKLKTRNGTKVTFKYKKKE